MAMTPICDLLARLQAAMDLAQTVECHEQANQMFQDILVDLQSQDDQTIQLFEYLWRGYLSSQRSSLFWEQISESEKRLSDRLAASHLQLNQNYLRLVQEQ
jgi:hypothetical protein